MTDPDFKKFQNELFDELFEVKQKQPKQSMYRKLKNLYIRTTTYIKNLIFYTFKKSK